MQTEQILIITLIIPLVSLPLMVGLKNNPVYRNSILLIATLTLFISSVLLAYETQKNNITKLTLAEPLPGIAIAFINEPAGIIFALIASFLWIITTIYSFGYLKANNKPRQLLFYSSFIIAITATIAIALSANLFTLYVFYEVLTLSTYPLVTHAKNDKAKKAGRIYLGILLFTSIALQLPAIIWIWSLTGTLEFTAGGILAGKVSGTPLVLLLLLFIFGVGKAALMPFHRWLPAAMVAPTPVSALLHAVAVVKAGVFAIVKIIVFIFGIDFLTKQAANEWLVYLPGFTIIIASIIALTQDNLKKRLAYSTISQLSYVVLATVILTPISFIGAMMHIVAHAFGKITLFFTAGAIATATGKTKISQLNGIGKQLPIIMIAFTIGALSMIGLPPVVGFVSKWYILMAAYEAESIAAMVIIIMSTLLNATYFVPIIYQAFCKKLHPNYVKEENKLPGAMIGAIIITASFTVILFFYHEPLLTLLKFALP